MFCCFATRNKQDEEPRNPSAIFKTFWRRLRATLPRFTLVILIVFFNRNKLTENSLNTVLLFNVTN
jgi:hypothetical protein